MNQAVNEAELDAEIERRVNAAMEKANLKTAHRVLHEARTQIKNMRVLDLPDDIALEFDKLADQIENVEWHVEQAVRKGATAES